MANTFLMWKGAVEPAETSPSGNEFKAWKGAVEPTGAVLPTNVFKMWKGAVEPAETSPSGNEFKAWKGAVEPGASDPVSGDPPLLTAVGTSSETATTLNLTATTDIFDGTAFGIIETVATKPSADQVEAGTGTDDLAAPWSGSITVTEAGIVIPAGLTLEPGVTYYGFEMQKSFAGDQSLVYETGAFTLTPYGLSAVWDGGYAVFNSLLFKSSGAHLGLDIVDDLLTAETLTLNEYQDATVINVTQDLSAIIDSNTAGANATIVGDLSELGQWGLGDSYQVQATAAINDKMWIPLIVSVSGEIAAVPFYLEDVSTTPHEWSEVETQNIVATGEADGDYTTALSVDGIVTLTPVSTGGDAFVSDLVVPLIVPLIADLVIN
ncbi:MAG: hypothetical protein GY918_14885 [Gammaproteobacteria bacterium]|nr:hypothetical protein [Gammaproteobacteria bacterium]